MHTTYPILEILKTSVFR